MILVLGGVGSVRPTSEVLYPGSGGGLAPPVTSQDPQVAPWEGRSSTEDCGFGTFGTIECLSWSVNRSPEVPAHSMHS